MTSEIRTDLIKDKSNTKTLATLSSSAVTLDSSVVFPAGGTGNPISVAVIVDEKAYNVQGGNSASSAEQTRHLNTVIYDTEGSNGTVTIESDTVATGGHTSTYKFTIGAGTYLIEWSTPAFKVNRHYSILYDDTASSELAVSRTMYCESGDNTENICHGFWKVSPTSNNTYYIKEFTAAAQSSSGLGMQLSHDSALKSYYTYVKITRIK
tara:strand:+ start:174 stop:800 length:627 start_codon:yes stop_codon:yes gene_type:complete